MTGNEIAIVGEIIHRALPALYWATEADRAIEHPSVIQRILTHLGRPRGRHRVRRPCEWMDQSCDVYTNVLTLFGRFRTLGFYGCL